MGIMKERPILMATESVKAILEGRKTMTRRLCKGARELSCVLDWPIESCPYGQVGDRLWVRETWCAGCATEVERSACYKVLDDGRLPKFFPFCKESIVKPSIFMPRWASRITLGITEIRVERLQEISDADCEAEGVRPSIEGNAQDWQDDENGWHRTFRQLWDSINPKYPWQSNPWVWCISFKRV
jgi:hypothetical protein